MTAQEAMDKYLEDRATELYNQAKESVEKDWANIIAKYGNSIPLPYHICPRHLPSGPGGPQPSCRSIDDDWES